MIELMLTWLTSIAFCQGIWQWLDSEKKVDVTVDTYSIPLKYLLTYVSYQSETAAA